MTEKLPLSVVLRICDVKIDEAELETRLQTEFGRFEPNGKSAHSYAQVDIACGPDVWESVLQSMRRLGPGLKKLLEDKTIGSVSLDIAWAMATSAPMMSRTIPATIAVSAGRHGIDIGVTVYISSDAD